MTKYTSLGLRDYYLRRNNNKTEMIIKYIIKIKFITDIYEFINLLLSILTYSSPFSKIFSLCLHVICCTPPRRKSVSPLFSCPTPLPTPSNIPITTTTPCPYCSDRMEELEFHSMAVEEMKKQNYQQSLHLLDFY